MIERRAPPLLASGLAACVVLAVTAARADDPTLTIRELGTWNDALAALRGDLGSQGRALHVAVLSGGAGVACDRYRLELDDAASRAFQVGACDPGTGETALVLAHRAALFDQAFDVPRPRTLSITAILTLRATAVAGGRPQGGSALRCSLAVQPYLDDLQHGTRVMLTPDRYSLRPGTTSVSVSPSPTGWSLSTADHGSIRIAYEVVERATGDVVLRQETTLSCGGREPPRAPEAPEAWIQPHGRVEIEWHGSWWPGEVLDVFGDETYRIHYTGYAASWDETVPRRRLRLPRGEASKGPEKQGVDAPPPEPSSGGECKWGRGRKGCNPSPASWTIMFGVMGGAAIAGATAAFYGASRQSDGLKRYGYAMPGALATLGAVVWTSMFGVGMHQLLHPPNPAPVRPSIAFSDRGGTLGVAGAF